MLSFLEKLLASVVGSLIMFGLIGGLLWFGAPKVWGHFMDAEAALRERPALLATIAADRDAASMAGKQCDARVASAAKSASLISRLAAPLKPSTPGAQPVLDAEALRSIVQ